MNNIVLDVYGYICLANVFYHRNGEFKLQLPREKLQQLCVEQSKLIEVYFYFNMKWSEMILAHLVAELKLIGFSYITLECPYLPFGRADKPEKENGCRQAIIKTFFKMLKKIGINEIVTRDFHLSNQGSIIEGIKFTNIDFADIWRDAINHIAKSFPNEKFLVFAPDMGANSRAQQTHNLISSNIGNNPMYCKHLTFKKERKENGVVLCGLEQYVHNPSYQNRICLIVDDIVDSGSTMLKAIKMVKEFKPKIIYVLVTHLLNDNFEVPEGVDFRCMFRMKQ